VSESISQSVSEWVNQSLALLIKWLWCLMESQRAANWQQLSLRKLIYNSTTSIYCLSFL